MPNNIIYSTHFEVRLKRLVKKFSSLLLEMRSLEEQLSQNPHLGTALGAGIYKIRIACESKGAGKSGGFRVITYVVNQTQDQTTINLISIYDKSEESTITKTDLLNLIKKIT